MVEDSNNPNPNVQPTNAKEVESTSNDFKLPEVDPSTQRLLLQKGAEILEKAMGVKPIKKDQNETVTIYLTLEQFAEIEQLAKWFFQSNVIARPTAGSFLKFALYEYINILKEKVPQIGQLVKNK